MAVAFELTAAANADRVALRTRGGERELTWGEYAEQVDSAALGLRGLGLEPSQSLAIMLTNRPEFHVADSAAMSLGATPFSLYQTLAPEQVAYQLSDSGTRIVITEPAFLDQVMGALPSAPEVEHVVLVEAGPGVAGVVSFDELLSTDGDRGEIAEARAAVEPGDLLTLIYTSGTTGPPKGVQITHGNIMSAVEALEEAVGFPKGARVVSYLPMAHIAERVTGHYLPTVLGHTVTCCPNPREVTAYLPEVRPTWFFAVPRIWEKLKAGIEAMIEGEPDEQRKGALQQALEVGHRKVRLEREGKTIPDDLARDHTEADAHVLSKVRARLGLDEAEDVYVGAAPTPMAVFEFFHAIGIPLAELWGLSESCGCGAVNLPGKVRLGTVGQVTPGMELTLAEDGEVLLRGPMIMKGYRNLPDLTAEAIDSDGWLHTGDIGELDGDGYLSIVDRKKELIITAGGKNISPANLESKLKAHSLIGTACVIGDMRPYLTALIVLDPDVAPAWGEQRGLAGLSLEELGVDDAVREEIQSAVDQLNSEVSSVEGVKKFTILCEDWVPGREELTPTMKLKRKPIAAKYAAEIEAMYRK
jgi:long-chain acyl-CoA synthetase